jgi:hypothetical protein
MIGNFLDTFGAKEKRRIKDRTDALVELLEKWARRYPFIRTIRIPMAALTTAIVLPRLSVSDAFTTAQMILWVFGVDDKADKRMITLEEMQRKAEQWYSIAKDGPGNDIDDSNELTAILLNMRERLSKSQMFEPLREYWASRLRIIVEVMAQEYQYALEYAADGARALPSLDEYLRGGIHSVGFPIWGSTVLILLKDSSVMERFEPIEESIKYTGTALRLYNDVSTLDKDIQEGDINSILIRYHAILDGNPNVTKERALSEAKQQVLQLADSYAQKCYASLEQLETDSGQFEETSSRLVAFHAHFYGYTEHDYHTTSQSETYEWLNSNTP